VTKLYKDSVVEKDSQIIKVSKLEALNDELKQNNVSQSKKLLDQQTVSVVIYILLTLCHELESKIIYIKYDTNGYFQTIFENHKPRERVFPCIPLSRFIKEP